MELRGLTANSVFVKAIDALWKYGDETAPRGQKIKELNNILLTVENPRYNIVACPIAKISRKYLVHEFIWYLIGCQDCYTVDQIIKYAKFWGTLVDPDGSLNSNYGYYIWDCLADVVQYDNKFFGDVVWNEGKNEYKSLAPTDKRKSQSQFAWVIEKLREDPDSRQAVININNPYHKLIDTKDFPCTIYLQFFIRKNQLTMTANMRSCDLRLGYCNDVFQFTMVQIMVWSELKKTYPNLELGPYNLFCGSLHLYERHFKMAEEILNSGYNPDKENIALCHFDWTPELYSFEYKDGESLANFSMDYNLLCSDLVVSIEALTDNAQVLFEVVRDDYEKDAAERYKHMKEIVYDLYH